MQFHYASVRGPIFRGGRCVHIDHRELFLLLLLMWSEVTTVVFWAADPLQLMTAVCMQILLMKMLPKL